MLAFFFAMKLINKTRRYFVFEYDGIPYNADGVKVEGGMIKFPFYKWTPFAENKNIATFKSVYECNEWFKDNEDNMKFAPNKRVDKTLYDVKSKALKMSNNDWEQIQKIMPNPDRFDQPEQQVRIFETYLANNFVDRDNERFRKDVIRSFANTIVGKNKLMSHKWGEPGNGRFFKSKVVKMTADETLDFLNMGHPDKHFADHLKSIEYIDGSIQWLVAYYYMLNITP